MNQMHGGDIYRNRVRMDFSVNVNPLGIPEPVKAALHTAVEACGAYPDMEAEELRRTLSEWLGVPEEVFLFGNGASELFLASLHALHPAKTVIPVPSFYGYEYAAKAAGSEIVYFPMQEEKGFFPGDGLLEALTEDVELLVLANPNNPTGTLLPREYLRKLLKHCGTKKIHVILDECFIEFCRNASEEEEVSVLSELGSFEHLILVRAFTKSFAVPGVRLGYLLCKNAALRERIRAQLPEWNLSCFAQAAGIACARQDGFLKQTAEYVRKERSFLEQGLLEQGLHTFPGRANFILCHSEKKWDELLLEQGILIRNCSNFRGLGNGYYRFAVKSRAENEALLRAMEEIRRKEKKSKESETKIYGSED